MNVYVLTSWDRDNDSQEILGVFHHKEVPEQFVKDMENLYMIPPSYKEWEDKFKDWTTWKEWKEDYYVADNFDPCTYCITELPVHYGRA